MIKDAYEKLRKKYKVLPDFEKIDNEFEISTIEKKDFLIRNIKRKINEKLELLNNVLDKMVHPDPASLIEMVEAKCFDYDDRSQIFELHKKLLLLQKDILELDLLQDEKTDVDFIKKITEQWSSIRKEMLPNVRKLKDCWKETKEIRETLAYLG